MCACDIGECMGECMGKCMGECMGKCMGECMGKCMVVGVGGVHVCVHGCGSNVSTWVSE